MARFPWGQGHSKQSSDNPQVVAWDRYSKDAVEPSRQAVTETMKESSSFESGVNEESPKYQGRSRTNTVASSFSFYARSVSDGSNDHSSRPSSRQSYRDSALASTERLESTAKSLLSKGARALKRQGSKLNLLPSPVEERSSGAVERAEESPVKGLQRQPAVTPKRPGGLKRSISGPFAFQHLSHGDHSDFQSIDIATQPELTSEVNAVQVGQQSDDQVQGFPVADLSSLRSEADSQADSTEPTLPTTSAIPYLPVTPPRPQPPPKDNLMSPYSPTQFRLSRSMENFSRPTRLSVTASDLSPISDLSRRLFSMGPISPTSVLGKPLPILPDIVHAVSTRDDIALPLRTAPLPSPPRAFMEVVVEELAEEQAVPTTKAVSAPRRDEGRHTPFVPGHRKRRSQSSGELHLDAAYYNLMSMITDVEAPDQETLTSPKGKRPQRISVGVKSTEIQDWEEAIDYSWDHAAELEDGRDNSDSDATLDRPRAPQVPQENYLVVEQRAVDETSSSASTPLMMQFPDRPSQVGQSMPAVASSHAFDQEPSSPLLGLGLGPLPPVPSLSVAAPEPEPVQGTRHNHSINSTESFRPLPVRNTLSSISKSSSTESIILSIASSIIGTHRSSNSSLTMSDFAHLASFGESVESLKLDLHDPSAASDGRVRERSQETIREGSPVTPSTDAAGSPTDLSMSSRSSFVEHELYAPGSHFSIPERNSSMPGVDISKAQVGRRRAGTGNSRPRRNTRVSYSLFPTPPPN